jgi:hypothetical protein
MRRRRISNDRFRGTSIGSRTTIMGASRSAYLPGFRVDDTAGQNGLCLGLEARDEHLGMLLRVA